MDRHVVFAASHGVATGVPTGVSSSGREKNAALGIIMLEYRGVLAPNGVLVPELDQRVASLSLEYRGVLAPNGVLLPELGQRVASLSLGACLGVKLSTS